MVPVADKARDSGRSFLQSHPWITFALRLDEMPWRFWEFIGEARSKCRHLANTPLPPGVARELSTLYLAKGVHATTAIEGNTLSEEEALYALRGQLELPVGQEYLGHEIANIAAACDSIEQGIHLGNGSFEITPVLLRGLNKQVLDGLGRPDHVVPGEFRDGSVVVGGVYRGAPAADCEMLVSFSATGSTALISFQAEMHGKAGSERSCAPRSPICTSHGSTHSAMAMVERLG